MTGISATKFSESIEIQGEAEQIFDYTQDYKNRLTWDTFLVKAELLDSALNAGKGVKAWCVSRNGLGMETEYVSFNRPKVTAIKMTKGPYMFKEFAASWTFKDTGEGVVTVIFIYTFKLRFPFSLGKIFVRGILQKNVRQRLRDLKSKFLERGASFG